MKCKQYSPRFELESTSPFPTTLTIGRSISNQDYAHELLTFVLSRLFGLLSSSLLLYSQCFGRCALRHFFRCFLSNSELTFRTRELSCRNRESSRNFELNPLFNITGVDCSHSVNHDRIQALSYANYSMLLTPLVRIEPETSDDCHLELYSPNSYIHCATCPPMDIWRVTLLLVSVILYKPNVSVIA